MYGLILQITTRQKTADNGISVDCVGRHGSVGRSNSATFKKPWWVADMTFFPVCSFFQCFIIWLYLDADCNFKFCPTSSGIIYIIPDTSFDCYFTALQVMLPVNLYLVNRDVNTRFTLEFISHKSTHVTLVVCSSCL